MEIIFLLDRFNAVFKVYRVGVVLKFKRLKFSGFFFHSSISCVLNCEDRLCIFSSAVTIYEIHIIFINNFNLITSKRFTYINDGIDIWDVGKTPLNLDLTVTVSVYALFLLSISSNFFNVLKKPVSPCRLLMKLEGIYYNPRKKMMTRRMMIKAVVRKVKQKSLLS